MRLEEFRERIISFLSFIGWSQARLTKESGLRRGRVTAILRRDNCRVTAEEMAAVMSVIENKTRGVDGPAPAPLEKMSTREALLAGLVIFCGETSNEKLKKMCSDLAHAIAQESQGIL